MTVQELDEAFKQVAGVPFQRGLSKESKTAALIALVPQDLSFEQALVKRGYKFVDAADANMRVFSVTYATGDADLVAVRTSDGAWASTDPHWATHGLPCRSMLAVVVQGLAEVNMKGHLHPTYMREDVKNAPASQMSLYSARRDMDIPIENVVCDVGTSCSWNALVLQTQSLWDEVVQVASVSGRISSDGDTVARYPRAVSSALSSYELRHQDVMKSFRGTVLPGVLKDPVLLAKYYEFVLCYVCLPIPMLCVSPYPYAMCVSLHCTGESSYPYTVPIRRSSSDRLTVRRQ
jgi:hypothetical protein